MVDPARCELIAADLKTATAMFDVLTAAAGIHGVEFVEIRFTARGGDLLTVGYGEQAEPAILEIEVAQ